MFMVLQKSPIKLEKSFIFNGLGTWGIMNGKWVHNSRYLFPQIQTVIVFLLFARLFRFCARIWKGKLKLRAILSLPMISLFSYQVYQTLCGFNARLKMNFRSLSIFPQFENGVKIARCSLKWNKILNRLN